MSDDLQMANIIFFIILTKKLKSTVINATSTFRHHNIILQNEKTEIGNGKMEIIISDFKDTFLKTLRLKRVI